MCHIAYNSLAYSIQSTYLHGCGIIKNGLLAKSVNM